jgi:hypothetical protein
MVKVWYWDRTMDGCLDCHRKICEMMGDGGYNRQTSYDSVTFIKLCMYGISRSCDEWWWIVSKICYLVPSHQTQLLIRNWCNSSLTWRKHDILHTLDLFPVTGACWDLFCTNSARPLYTEWLYLVLGACWDLFCTNSATLFGVVVPRSDYDPLGPLG